MLDRFVVLAEYQLVQVRTLPARGRLGRQAGLAPDLAQHLGIGDVAVAVEVALQQKLVYRREGVFSEQRRRLGDYMRRYAVGGRAFLGRPDPERRRRLFGSRPTPGLGVATKLFEGTRRYRWPGSEQKATPFECEVPVEILFELVQPDRCYQTPWSQVIGVDHQADLSHWLSSHLSRPRGVGAWIGVVAHASTD